MMLEYLLLLVSLFRTVLYSRADPIAANLLLRQQLAVLSRPTRRRPRLRSWDMLFWVVIRALRRDWRRHLVLVQPDTVVRWHRQGIVKDGNCSGGGAPAAGSAVPG
jgi:hypothetical protein